MEYFYRLRSPINGLKKYLTENEFENISRGDKYFYDELNASNDTLIEKKESLSLEDFIDFNGDILTDDDYENSQNNLANIVEQQELRELGFGECFPFYD